MQSVEKIKSTKAPFKLIEKTEKPIQIKSTKAPFKSIEKTEKPIQIKPVKSTKSPITAKSHHPDSSDNHTDVPRNKTAD